MTTTEQLELVSELEALDEGDTVAFELQGGQTLTGTVTVHEEEANDVNAYLEIEPDEANKHDLPRVDTTVVVSTGELNGHWDPVQAHAEFPTDEIAPMENESKEKSLGVVVAIERFR